MPASVQDYLRSRYSRVSDFFSRETSELALSCLVNDKIADILPLLAEPTQSSLGVLDETGRLVGVISERDIVRLSTAGDVTFFEMRVSEVMTKNPTTISSDLTCLEALELMLRGKFRTLPVLESDRFVGLLSVLQAINGRLIARAETNKELFQALTAMREAFPTVDINSSAQDMAKIMKNSNQSIAVIMKDDQVVDYITNIEALRLAFK